MIKIFITVIAVIVAVFTGMAVFSQNNEQVVNQASEPEHSKSTVIGLQRIARQAYIDPQTGELTSKPSTATITQSNQVAQSNNSKVKPIEVVNHSNGMVQINLNGNGMSSMRVSLGCDGQVVAEHTLDSASDNTDCQVQK